MTVECRNADTQWSMMCRVNGELLRHGLKFDPCGKDPTGPYCKWVLKKTEPEKVIEAKKPQPKFKRGDLVRHRASGEIGVVMGIEGDRWYGVHVGFKSSTSVEEIVLELVEKQE